MLNIGCMLTMCGSLNTEVSCSERWEWIAKKPRQKAFSNNYVKDLSP